MIIIVRISTTAIANHSHISETKYVLFVTKCPSLCNHSNNEATPRAVHGKRNFVCNNRPASSLEVEEMDHRSNITLLCSGGLDLSYAGKCSSGNTIWSIVNDEFESPVSR